MNSKEKTLEYNTYESVITFLTINALAHSSKLEEKIKLCKSCLDLDDFLDILKDYVVYLREYNYFSEKAYNNIKQILSYKNFDQKKVLNIKEELKKVVNFSNDLYMMEFQYHINDIEMFRENSSQIVYQKYFEEMLFFDVVTLTSLIVPNHQFIDKYFDSLVLNKKFLYSINKLRYTLADIFKNESIVSRLINILDFNINMINGMDQAVRLMYFRNNDNNYIYLSDMERFKEKNIKLKDNINKQPYMNQNMKNYYHFLALEAYIYENIDDKNSIITLHEIYLYIDSVVDKSNYGIYINSKTKERLINILNLKKDQAMNKEEYNSYLLKINKLNTNEIDIHLLSEYDSKTTLVEKVFNYIKPKSKHDDFILKIKNTNYFDLLNFTSFIMPEFFYQKQKEKFYDTYYPYSIRKFLKENNEIFAEESINERAREILNHYDNKMSKKLIKKLKRYE